MAGIRGNLLYDPRDGIHNVGTGGVVQTALRTNIDYARGTNREEETEPWPETIVAEIHHSIKSGTQRGHARTDRVINFSGGGRCGSRDV